MLSATNTVYLIIILVTSFKASRMLVRYGELEIKSDRIIAIITLFVAWCVACTLDLAITSEIICLNLVRMHYIACMSLVMLFLLYKTLKTQLSVRIKTDTMRNTISGKKIDKFAIYMCVVPVALLHLFLFFNSLMTPPCDHDGVYYHLPMMLRWLAEGRLFMIPAEMRYSMPGNCEVWQMLFVSTRFEPVFEISLVPIGLLCAITIYAISRTLGAGRAASVIASCFAMACPIVALQVYSSYVDLFGSAFLLGQLFWGIRFCQSVKKQNVRYVYLLLYGVCAGMCIGTKLTFIGWSGLIGIFSVILLFATLFTDRLYKKYNYKNYAQWVCVVALFAVLCSGFWYVRNMINTGWFLYPLQFQIAGQNFGVGGLSQDKIAPTEGAGLIDIFYPWTERVDKKEYYSLNNGLGAHFAVYVIPGCIYLFIRKRKTRDIVNKSIRILILPFIIIGFYLFIVVFNSYPRLTVPFWLLMIPASALFVGTAIRLQRKTSILLLFVSIVLSSVMTALPQAKQLLGRIRDVDMSREYLYEIPDILDNQTSGTVVLSMIERGSNNYALFGNRFSNTVIDSLLAPHMQLFAPLSADMLKRHNINIVITKDSNSPPFDDTVRYDVLYDNTEDPLRLSTSRPTQVYRVLY